MNFQVSDMLMWTIYDLYELCILIFENFLNDNKNQW